MESHDDEMIETNNKSAPTSLDLFMATNPHTKMGAAPHVNLSCAHGHARLKLGRSRRTALQGFPWICVHSRAKFPVFISLSVTAPLWEDSTALSRLKFAASQRSAPTLESIGTANSPTSRDEKPWKGGFGIPPNQNLFCNGHGFTGDSSSKSVIFWDLIIHGQIFWFPFACIAAP